MVLRCYQRATSIPGVNCAGGEAESNSRFDVAAEKARLKAILIYIPHSLFIWKMLCTNNATGIIETATFRMIFLLWLSYF